MNITPKIRSSITVTELAVHKGKVGLSIPLTTDTCTASNGVGHFALAKFITHGFWMQHRNFELSRIEEVQDMKHYVIYSICCRCNLILRIATHGTNTLVQYHSIISTNVGRLINQYLAPTSLIELFQEIMKLLRRIVNKFRVGIKGNLLH